MPQISSTEIEELLEIEENCLEDMKYNKQIKKDKKKFPHIKFIKNED